MLEIWALSSSPSGLAEAEYNTGYAVDVSEMLISDHQGEYSVRYVQWVLLKGAESILFIHGPQMLHWSLIG